MLLNTQNNCSGLARAIQAPISMTELRPQSLKAGRTKLHDAIRGKSQGAVVRELGLGVDLVRKARLNRVEIEQYLATL